MDTGIGFKNRINKRFNSSLNAVQAIVWAIQDKKTTKEGVPGGIGLAVLKEFIEKNKGKMQIVSNDGFYQFDCKEEVSKQFMGQFPGTIVNLQFRTDDKSNYSLKSEIAPLAQVPRTCDLTIARFSEPAEVNNVNSG